MFLNLIHFSIKENLTEINPKYFSENYFTRNDYKLSDLNRSFFYINGSQVESRFKGQNCYNAIVDSDKLYNITENKLQLNIDSIDSLLRQIKSMGFLGIIYTINNLHIANIFYPLKVNKI